MAEETNEKIIHWKGQELSDLQQMSNSLDFNSRWMKRLVFWIAIFGSLFFITIWWIIFKVISSGAVNHYIAKCVN